MKTQSLAVLLLAAPAVAEEQSFPATEQGLIEFMTPSQNIGCVFVPEGGTAVYVPRDGGPELACDRVEPGYVSVVLGPEGPPIVIEEPGEAPCCSGPVLDYGNSWSEGPFTCTSAHTGLTCTREDGPGFSMARAKIEVF
ncbi:MAG: hypothetical protein OEM24_02965 [Paracoccaceae bacterium]|nr:hypothetical protein [Paracoccaceae bacterium]